MDEADKTFLTVGSILLIIIGGACYVLYLGLNGII